jgi:hypothetical protein
MEKRPLQKASATGANLRWPPKKEVATRTKSTARNGCTTKRNKKSSGINGGGPEIDRNKEIQDKEGAAA